MPLVNVNCDCEDDTTGRRTLAELRSALTTALGFVAEQGNAPARTLAEMRFDLIRQLGFTDLPADPPAQTLAQIRAQVEHHLGFVSQQDDPPPRDLESMRLDLMRRLGFSAQANNPPPGMSEMLASFLEDAQETVYHRFELDQSGSYSLAPFSAPGDITTIDPRPVLLLALANAKAHYGQPDAKAYYDQVERYLSDVMRRNPPGATERLDAFIRSAQETVFRRFEMDGDGVYALAPLIADTDTTSIDPQAIVLLATGNAKAQYGQPDAKLYADQFEQYAGDRMRRQPPGLTKRIDSILRSAQETAYRRFELGKDGDYQLQPFDQDSDLITIDPQAVMLLALASAKASFGQADAKGYSEQFERYAADLLRRRPPNLKAVLNAHLHSAQEQLYRRYDVLRTERFFSWPLVEGVGMFDIPGNTEACEKRLDPRKVSWVGIEYDDAWTPLRCGIEPELYSHDQSGRPQRYEIRQCIEVWPRPDETRGRLVIKGRFGLEPFTEDSHRATIDDQAIYLMALANAKSQYQQGDAANYLAQLETLISGLVAGSHHTRRYVPGRSRRTDGVYAIPRPSEPFPHG